MPRPGRLSCNARFVCRLRSPVSRHSGIRASRGRGERHAERSVTAIARDYRRVRTRRYPFRTDRAKRPDEAEKMRSFINGIYLFFSGNR